MSCVSDCQLLVDVNCRSCHNLRGQQLGSPNIKRCSKRMVARKSVVVIVGIYIQLKSSSQ